MKYRMLFFVLICAGFAIAQQATRDQSASGASPFWSAVADDEISSGIRAARHKVFGTHGGHVGMTRFV